MIDNLTLIDWKLVGFSALWILGLSVMLATFSFADYVAHQRDVRTRAVLKGRHYQASFNAGLGLFSLGLMGSARTWWQTALWGLLGLAFFCQLLMQIRAKGDPAQPEARPPDGEAGKSH